MLNPAENIALTIARAQLDRGEIPPPNISCVCIMALMRIVDEQELDVELAR